MMRGGDLFKLQQILSHQRVQMTRRYAHLAPHRFHEDYDRSGEPLLEFASIRRLK
jgi:site-specific recombinase XerD